MNNLYFQETDTDTIAVYEILCLQTGRRYIGSSKNVRVRWRGHAFALAANNHTCEGLQNDYNSGYDFIFSVIQSFDIISKKELLEKEAAEISRAEYLYKYAPPTGSHTNATCTQAAITGKIAIISKAGTRSSIRKKQESRLSGNFGRATR